MGVSILRNRLNPYNSLYFNKLQVFRSFGDMLIGSKIPPQADIIKFVITGGDPRVAGCGAVCQAKILASLKIKNGISLTPLNCALNAFTLALKDSADALVERLSK